ncbi:MAG: FAD-dependent monooxygenase [Cyanobacteria bacterium SBLK]|nr:FAD-dependent monooxygenase [Cyanobacteria bacterium SBLK]
MVQKIVIVGAGPAGVLLAHYLLRREDCQIEIYERRSDPTLSDYGSDRSFPISLFPRGRLALQKIEGLDKKVGDRGSFCQGSLMYSGKGKTRLLSRKEPLLTIDRNNLVTALLDTLREKYESDRCTIHFNCQCVGLDTTENIVRFQDKDENRLNVNYDRLIGADGARSSIRQYLQEQGKLNARQEYVSDAYKSLFFPRIKGDLELAPDKIHIWRRPGNVTVLLVPQFEKFLSGVIIFPADRNPLEPLKTKEEILAYFQENFPVFARLMSLDEAEALLQNPVARVLTVRCDRFHYGDRILIVGDAAHAVSPSIGQGCNSALEDVLVLDRVIEKSAENWSQIFSEFTTTRLADAHAVQELSSYSLPRNKRLMFEFVLQIMGRRFLHKLFPNSFKPFIFDLLANPDLSYSEILHSSRNWIAKVKRSQKAKIE